MQRIEFSCQLAYVSLFTRERIEIGAFHNGLKVPGVSLFTRERIEILPCECFAFDGLGFPLYEGAD